MPLATWHIPRLAWETPLRNFSRKIGQGTFFENPICMNTCYCSQCRAFRPGFIEYITSSKRKLYYRFICSWCLLPSEGIIIRKKDKKGGVP